MATIKNIFGKKEQAADKAALKEVPPSNQTPQPTEPVAAAHLEAAMVDNIRNDTPETRAKVYQELLFSDLLLALAERNPDSFDTPQAQPDSEGTVNVAILSNPQGVQFSAAFTSAAAARRWRTEGGQYISIRGQDIFKLLEPSPVEVFVINPGSAPFVFLNKVDCRQLAMGVVPQKAVSPVQVGTSGPASAQGPGGQAPGMQIAFPPDAFTEEQRQHVFNTLINNDMVDAAALGAILPANANQQEKDNWLRTIFLRINNLDENQETMQKFCMAIRDSMMVDNDFFTDVKFEVGVMPDPKFWAAVNQNKFILLDKNPPTPPSIESEAQNAKT